MIGLSRLCMVFVTGLLLGCAIAIKYVAAIALPFLAARSRRGGNVAPALAVALAILVPVLCAHPFQAGTAGSQALASNGSRFAMSVAITNSVRESTWIRSKVPAVLM